MRFFAIVLLLIGLLIQPAIAQDKKESAFDRVTATNTLRCGYIVWPPLFNKDPNTGKFSGIFYEYTEALGKALNLKVEWAEELSPGSYIESLKSNRVDMLCSGDWPSATRARHIDYLDPIFFIPLMPHVRADDTRFDGDLSKINNPSVTIVAPDGEMSALIAAQDFPNAKTLQLPQTVDASQMLLSVVGGKADVALVATTDGATFMKSNPGKLKAAKVSRPVRLFPNAISLLLGEDRLRQMMNTATRELIYTGEIDKIIDRYDEKPAMLLRATRPYRAE